MRRKIPPYYRVDVRTRIAFWRVVFVVSVIVVIVAFIGLVLTVYRAL